MASPPSKNFTKFRRAFREASPIFGRASSPDTEEAEPQIEISEEEVEFARRMTSSIERLTDIARRDSFSSISSCGQREQFKTALTNIQSSIFGEKERTPIMDHKPQPSGSNDSDHDFEHLDAPDPFELASYHASTGTTAPVAAATNTHQKMDFPHDSSPEHHHHQQPLSTHHQHEEPVDPFASAAAHTGHHDELPNVLNRNKEELLVDFDSEEPVAHHHETYVGSNVHTDPEPPTVFDAPTSDFHLQTRDESPQFHAEPRLDSPEIFAAERPNETSFGDVVHLNQRDESPVLPEEPAPVTRDFEDDFIRHSPPISPPHHEEHHHTEEHLTAAQPHHDEVEENRRQIEEHIHSAIDDVHDEVDAILERLGTPDEVIVPPAQDNDADVSPSGDSERDTVGNLVGEASYNEPEPNMPQSDSTHGMRENSPDEQTFDRRGPLTIPTHTEKNESPTEEKAPFEDDFEPVQNSSHFNQIPPRPPTPPKDLNDDDVNPQAIDLGPAPVHHYEKSPDDTSGLKPILKHHSDVEPWLTNQHVDHRVLDIIYWRDPKKSGIVLASIFVALFLFAKFSLLSIVTYTSIALLISTVGFRVFKLAEAKFKKTEDKNPFQPLLEKELEVPQEKIHAQVDVLVENARNIALQLRRLFFVENLLDSVKFFFLLYSLTYISSWFSGFALIILFVVGVFTIPKVYELNKEQIDNYLNLAKENVDKLHQTVGEKLPFLKQSPVAPPVKKDE